VQVPTPQTDEPGASPYRYSPAVSFSMALEEATYLVRGTVPDDPDDQRAAVAEATARPEVVGVYSDPVISTCLVCPGDPAAKPDLNFAPCDPQKKLYRSDAVSTPQLGQLRYLPFSNGPFEANELALTLREDGSVDSFAYKKTRAAGTGMVASAADAADQYKAYRDARDKKRTDAVTAARAEQIAQLQYQIDLLTKQKDILKLQKPDEDDPNAAVKTQTIQIEAQTALLAAKLAQLRAEASLAEAGGS